MAGNCCQFPAIKVSCLKKGVTLAVNKKTNLPLIFLNILIILYLTSCKSGDAKMVSKVPDGFVSLIELNNRADKILRCVLWETQISFMDDDGYICIYQTTFVNNPDLIVKYKKEYYVNEAKYLELTEVAVLAREERQRTYSLGDIVEILGADSSYYISILEVNEKIIDNKKIFDIEFSAPDVAESDLKSIFSFVEITVMNSSNSGTDNLFEFVDTETVRLEMKPDRKIDAIILKSPEYLGLTYRILVE